MGLAVDHVENVDIWLNGPMDMDTEERLLHRVSGIGARGNMMA